MKEISKGRKKKVEGKEERKGKHEKTGREGRKNKQKGTATQLLYVLQFINKI
jgi:hypothetical protein